MAKMEKEEENKEAEQKTVANTVALSEPAAREPVLVME